MVCRMSMFDTVLSSQKMGPSLPGELAWEPKMSYLGPESAASKKASPINAGVRPLRGSRRAP